MKWAMFMSGDAMAISIRSALVAAAMLIASQLPAKAQTLLAPGEADSLPGVVLPTPEPPKAQADEPAGDAVSGRTFKAGNWDVTISGSVSVEIGKYGPALRRR